MPEIHTVYKGYISRRNLPLSSEALSHPAGACNPSDVRGERLYHQSFLKCQAAAEKQSCMTCQCVNVPSCHYFHFFSLCRIQKMLGLALCYRKYIVILETHYIRIDLSFRNGFFYDLSEFAAWGWWYLKLMSVTFETVPSSIMTARAVSLPVMFCTSHHWYLTVISPLCGFDRFHRRKQRCSWLSILREERWKQLPQKVFGLIPHFKNIWTLLH